MGDEPNADPPIALLIAANPAMPPPGNSSVSNVSPIHYALPSDLRVVREYAHTFSKFVHIQLQPTTAHVLALTSMRQQ